MEEFIELKIKLIALILFDKDDSCKNDQKKKKNCVIFPE